VSSIPPGAFVQSLVTAVHNNGLNLQILGYFDGTVDEFHFRQDVSYKVGTKLKARVLYDLSSTPPRFALSLSDHILRLSPRLIGAEEESSLQKAYPVGTILESVKVLRVEVERGLIVEIQPGLEGFIHVSPFQ
jgi:rRNA biogenesis protein RRP5